MIVLCDVLHGECFVLGFTLLLLCVRFCSVIVLCEVLHCYCFV